MDCLNAGHGGLEVGANHERTNESNLALKCVNWLQGMYYEAGRPVYLTRNDDVSMSLERRVNMANHSGVDKYISIHFNQFHDPKAHGFTVFHYPGSTNGKRLAESIHDQMADHKLESRGVRASDDQLDDDNHKYMYELAETNMPAVLVEMGFLSSPHDRPHLTDDEFLYNHTKKVFDGIINA
jgi:N-acetylmuramoyl-L-alanine amidase